MPEHGSHSIAWCLWHTARVEDLIINARIRQAAAGVERGVGEAHRPARSRASAPACPTTTRRACTSRTWPRFGEYQQAVFAQTDAYLDTLTDADLEREMPTRGGGTESVGQAISLHMMGHFNGHRGEINTLRGMQGMPTVLAVRGHALAPRRWASGRRDACRASRPATAFTFARRGCRPGDRESSAYVAHGRPGARRSPRGGGRPLPGAHATTPLVYAATVSSDTELCLMPQPAMSTAGTIAPITITNANQPRWFGPAV